MHTPLPNHQSELKFQGWRALAVLEDGGECLLYVGRSAPHVQSKYAGAFTEVLDGPERARVCRISLERWEGAADQGRWVAKTRLDLPSGADDLTPSPCGRPPASGR